MKYITVKPATHKAIAEAAIGAFQTTGRRLQGGDWEVPVDDDTYWRLMEYAGGAQIDIAIRRLIIEGKRKLENGMVPAPETDDPSD